MQIRPGGVSGHPVVSAHSRTKIVAIGSCSGTHGKKLDKRSIYLEGSVLQAAEAISVSPQRVRALAAAGQIPARKLGRD